MANSTSQKAPKTETSLEALITAAGKRAAAEIRDRNQRMGWPLIVEPVPKDSSDSTLKTEHLLSWRFNSVLTLGQ